MPGDYAYGNIAAGSVGPSITTGEGLNRQPPRSPLVSVIADLGFALDEQARLLETLYERLENGGILVMASPQEPTATQPCPQMSFRVGEVLAQFHGHVRVKNDLLRGMLERLAL